MIETEEVEGHCQIYNKFDQVELVLNRRFVDLDVDGECAWFVGLWTGPEHKHRANMREPYMAISEIRMERGNICVMEPSAPKARYA